MTTALFILLFLGLFLVSRHPRLQRYFWTSPSFSTPHGNRKSALSDWLGGNFAAFYADAFHPDASTWGDVASCSSTESERKSSCHCEEQAKTIAQLEQRIQVLEAIATDPRENLRRKIDSL